MKNGESEELCKKLVPQPSTKNILLGPTIDHSSPLASTSIESEDSGKKNLIWLGIGVAALGGFFLWKSRQPSFRSVDMR